MEQYAMYLRKSRFDRDYAELSVEETLKRHKAILDRTAEERRYYIAQIYYEVVSGESIAARPEIQKLLEAVGNELYAGVLVVDLERLARGNSADQAYISQVFQFSSTKIITPAKTYDPNNEYDEDFFEFGLFMSRREYKTINRRLLRGRDSSASEGKYISSIAPYGYQKKKLENEKGFTLEPDPEEADVVKKIFQMFLQHNGTKTIANYLNDQKIPTRHGDLWTYSTISNIVTNPVYAGKIRRGWSKQVKSMEDGVVKKHINHLPANYREISEWNGTYFTRKAMAIANLVEPEYQKKMNKRILSRLRSAHLRGCPQERTNCVDSAEREYLPRGITETLSTLDFIESGLNVCILGPSDSGKSYLAKAIGITACNSYKVEYHHCESLLEALVALKAQDYSKYQKRLKKICGAALLILDDFLLHTITDEREVKILFEILEKRCEINLSTIICSQREPASWSSMILNDEVSANAILKRATKHYTVVIKPRMTV